MLQWPAHAGQRHPHRGHRREQHHIPRTLPLPGLGTAPQKAAHLPRGCARCGEAQVAPTVSERAMPPSGGAALTEQQRGVHAVEEHPADHRPAQGAQGPAHEDVVDVADVLADIGGQGGEGGTQHRDAQPLQGRVRGHLARPAEASAPAPQPRGRLRSLIHSPAPGRRRRASRRCTSAAPARPRSAARRRPPPPQPPPPG